MSVTCGGFTKVLTVQDANNTHTLMDPEVFISGLIAMNKVPQDYTIQELKTILLKNKRKTEEVGIAIRIGKITANGANRWSTP